MKDAGPAGHHRACVLIVEDDDDVREFMQLLVSTAGYETMTARDGQDALVKMRRSPASPGCAASPSLPTSRA